MMLLQFRFLIFLSAAAACMQLLGCQGGGTDCGEGFIAGTLFTDGGAKTASNASVRILKYADPNSAVGALSKNHKESREFSFSTNARGEIFIPASQSPGDGWYVVFGGLGQLKSMKDSVYFEDGTCEYFLDTLQESGSLTGRVKELLEEKNHGSTYVYVLNTYPVGLYQVDDSGTFTLSDFAPGRYYIRVDTKYDQYKCYDTVITIRAGYHDTIPEPIVLITGLPVTGFKETVDRYMRCVTFSWNRIDPALFGGYLLRTYERGESGLNELDRPMLYDTSVSLYIKEYIQAKVRTVDPAGEFTATLTVKPENVVSIKTIVPERDSIRAIGWAIANDRFWILETSRYDSRNAYLSVYDREGRWEADHSLTGKISEPLAIASYGDSLFVLEKKPDEVILVPRDSGYITVSIPNDTICFRKLGIADSVSCAMSFNLPSNFGNGFNLEIGSGGNIFISQYMTVHVISPEGRILFRQDHVCSHFALTDSCLFTMSQQSPELPQEMTERRRELESLIDSLIMLHDTLQSAQIRLEIEQAQRSLDSLSRAESVQPPKKVSRFALGSDGRLEPTGHFVYDKYNIILDSPRLFAANNGGTLCCLTDMSLFVFFEEKKLLAEPQRKPLRLYVEGGPGIVDLILSEQDILHILYERGRIDVVDLKGSSYSP